VKKKIILVIMSLLFCFSLFSQNIFNGLGIDSTISKEETNYTCTPLPSSKPPAQHSSAEGVPPLPLPVVPLRRTEKKNPPRPPVLVAKVSTNNLNDWATNPSDINNLLKWMASNLNVHFSSINMPEKNIPSDPKSVPILYRTGHEAFEFSDEVREKIRQYLLGGGTIIFDACCGRKEFFISAYREAEKLIPERSPYRLSLDHPIYSSFFEINHVGYRPWALKAGAKNNQASAIGIDIGCRTAVFIFRWDLSCGWDGLEDSDRHHCLGYDIKTANQIGSNLMAYITAERSSALPLSQALEFVDAKAGKSGKFSIAQVTYDGLWKTRSAGLSMLLNAFYEQTGTPVIFKRDEIRLDSPRIFDFPFLYMTGHNDFVLSRKENSQLSSFLSKGGILIAESCCGREAFDHAFRKEIEKLHLKLEKIPSTDIIFSYPNKISNIMARPALSKKLGSRIVPMELYGVKTCYGYSIIYSPYGLSCGWELAQCPYCKGIESKDALAIGVNILSYAILH